MTTHELVLEHAPNVVVHILDSYWKWIFTITPGWAVLTLDRDTDFNSLDLDWNCEPFLHHFPGPFSMFGKGLDDEGVVDLNKWFDKKPAA